MPLTEDTDMSIILLDAYIEALRIKYHQRIGGLFPVTSTLHNTLFRPGIQEDVAVQIHYTNNHFVVSHKIYNKVFVYNSLSDRTISKDMERLVRFYYRDDKRRALQIEQRMVMNQGQTSKCGFVAAATAHNACMIYDKVLVDLPLKLNTLIAEFVKILTKYIIEGGELIEFQLRSNRITENPNEARPSTPEPPPPPKPEPYTPPPTNKKRGGEIPATGRYKTRSDKWRRSPPPRRRQERPRKARRSKRYHDNERRRSQRDENNERRSQRDENERRNNERRRMGTEEEEEATHKMETDEDFPFYSSEGSSDGIVSGDEPHYPSDDESNFGVFSTERGFFIPEQNNTNGLFNNAITSITVKRTIAALSDFLNFTVFQTIQNSVRDTLGNLMKIEDTKIDYLVDNISPLMVRRKKNPYEEYNMVLRRYQPPPSYWNPTPTTAGGVHSNNIVRDVIMKRDLEKEVIIRRGITKASAKFVKTIIKRDFFNHNNRPTNLEWMGKPIKMTEISILPTGERRAVQSQGIVSFNMKHLEHIYKHCFPGLVRSQPLEQQHKYIADITLSLNKLASLVNSIGKGTNNPLSMAFACFKKANTIQTLQDFKILVTTANYGDLNQDNLLTFEFSEFFGNKDNKLFNYLNPNQIFNYNNPMNALLLDDVAQDILPFMVSEVLLLTLVFFIEAIFPNTISNKIDGNFKRAFEEGTGCFTVLQCFPGLFTLICNWAFRFEQHKLGFVQSLKGINNGQRLTWFYIF
ncbi:Hypothetical predicted protein [Mytilus galloprovincialis]|uniref:Uncharacterized protein n=1 Tax=Mytilus galloprovincialis TaxID=29158 RepID=A0A8B6E2V4_MYTGA|nr:Hypothetical predicted protein [Mytilus galloprovincialis]